jgi:hypothetical protein
MDVVCSLTLSLFIYAELTIQSKSSPRGACWNLPGFWHQVWQAECLLSNHFLGQIIPRTGASRSREIDDNDAKMADPVDGDDVSFIIS